MHHVYEVTYSLSHAHITFCAPSLLNTEDIDMDAGGAVNYGYKEQDSLRPYEHHHVNSFASSVSSATKNMSASCSEENITASTAGLTPSRASSSGHAASANASQAAADPETPHEVRLHFQLNTAQCSPIPGIPEEDTEHSLGSSNKSSSMAFPSRPRLNLSTSQGSASSGASQRPMPDMNAFDGHANDTSTQSSHSNHDADAPHSPRLLCPPTPVRTPAWAHNEMSSGGGFPVFSKVPGQKKMPRQNSLIATKVLAMCSPQVLDGRASLENSILEEGKSDSMSAEASEPQQEGSLDQGTNNSSGATAKSTSSGITSLSMKHSGPKELEWLHHAPRAPAQLKVDDDEDDDDEEESGARREDESGHVHAASAHEVSMAVSFEVLSTLGSGNFADVYKVRSNQDGRMYAIKRNRRQFRGKRDREAALSEVRSMQRLQSHMASPAMNQERANYSLYLLFFFQAWQEEGHFFCQTELCCRDTCREMMDALRSQWNVAKTRYPSLRQLTSPEGAEGRWMPEDVVWKICHDIGAGLSHIHAHGLVHNDIKPSNVFFVRHPRFGALCKIGDFGMTRSVGSSEDGQEGDQKYMALELLESAMMHPSADIFSLGLTLYEMASNLPFVVPSEGPRWHEVRSGQHFLDIPACRSAELVQLVRLMISPVAQQRPAADIILSNSTVIAAGKTYNRFLYDYIHDVEECERRFGERVPASDKQTPRHASRPLCSPSFGTSGVPVPPVMMHSPPAPN